jgi:hypothetical protein
LKDIEAARDALLEAYQAKGYQSVYVDLPEQQVTQGLVFRSAKPAWGGESDRCGIQLTCGGTGSGPRFAGGVVPDFSQAQQELTALNRTGRRQVMPVVRQGSLPGTMDVDLKVEDNSPWRASAGLNNDRSADTKDMRLSASLGHDNLWQLGHSASFSVFTTPQDTQQTMVWSGSYSAPLRGTQWNLEASAYNSDSDVSTVGGTSVVGKGYAFGLKAGYTVPDSGAWWHNFSFGVDFKNNKESLRFGGTSDDVPLKYAPITLAYSGYYQGERLQYGLGMSLVTGTRSLFGWGSDWKAFYYKRYKSSPSFQLVKADFNGSYALTNESQLGWRLAAQVTDSPWCRASKSQLAEPIRCAVTSRPSPRAISGPLGRWSGVQPADLAWRCRGGLAPLCLCGCSPSASAHATGRAAVPVLAGIAKGSAPASGWALTSTGVWIWLSAQGWAAHQQARPTPDLPSQCQLLRQH